MSAFMMKILEVKVKLVLKFLVEKIKRKYAISNQQTKF